LHKRHIFVVGGHFKPFQKRFLVQPSCVASDKMSNDAARRAVSLRQLSFLLLIWNIRTLSLLCILLLFTILGEKRKMDYQDSHFQFFPFSVKSNNNDNIYMDL